MRPGGRVAAGSVHRQSDGLIIRLVATNGTA